MSLVPLFILYYELLTKAFKQRGGQLGIQVTGQSERISHLLYADDILVFAEATRNNTILILRLLESYCGWTGQKINGGKSAILFNRKCPVWRKNMVAKVVGFRKVTSLEYLKFPLTIYKPKAADFGKLIKNVHDKTNLWGKKHLSFAARALLIKTSLLTVPMYLSTHIMVPKSILHSIEKIARKFMWQKDSNSRGMHYVAWKELCQSRNQGGLGFYCLEKWQSALRARLAWDMIQNSESLLNKVLIAKYGSDVWCSVTESNVSITWKIIQDGAKALHPIIRWKIGDGQSINVLNDMWILDRKIANWPTFVNMEMVDNVNVSSLLDSSLQWDMKAMEDCFGKILGQRIKAITTNNGNGVDSPELCYSRSSLTVTAMAYRASIDIGGYPFVWFDKLKLHPREIFFWWRVLKKAISNNSWMFHRGLSESMLCPWGCNEEETLDHCITQCNKLRQVISILGKWGFGIPCVNFLEELLRELGDCVNKNTGIGCIYYYVVYQLWRAHNDLRHGRSYQSPSVIAATALSLFPRPCRTPILEQWSIIQPSGLPSHKLWCPPPLQVGLSSTLMRLLS
ncbi:Putative ribonuclease H protein [Dendrobium catenatum]|uniref:Ribonuclease H protein n=1 Tax=Dendrobium catenatum TaxID=906689 RepID=A0A2I0X925_9ASPA|nr:Putative ribonuclease H protein [Dendrobium catenatum]